MKRLAIFLGCVALMTFTIGCDEATLNSLPSDVQAMVSSYFGLKTDMSARPINPGQGDMLQLRDRDRDQLQDGSCEGDGSQNQAGGSNGAGG
ncbi:MAG: hypothetical protein KDA33_10135, partial [Phycisphaerales bacterium]|nr:hypothetical protein [Phycisphaerales bacterium]